MMTAWAWHYQYGCHAHFTTGSTTFKHVTKNPTKNQNFSKILFASFHMMQKASERYIKHFSTCNIKGAEKISWSFPVHLFPGVPGSPCWMAEHTFRAKESALTVASLKRDQNPVELNMVLSFKVLFWESYLKPFSQESQTWEVRTVLSLGGFWSHFNSTEN